MRAWVWALVVLVPANLIADEPNVHLLATGGTIADGRSGSLSAADLKNLDPALSGLAQLSVEDYLAIGSTRMTPEQQFGIARRVNVLFREQPELSGIVVTHGTDSLEETAFLVDLLLQDDRPVVFTGAMRPPRRSDTDAKANLVSAVRLAASSKARGLGVVVAMNDEIHAARDVRKTHTASTDAFASPGFGPLGYVDGETIYLARRPVRRLTLDVDAIEPRVSIVRLFAGSDGSQIRAAVASGQKGVVVEVFGRGNAPPKVMDAIREARASGVTIVFAARAGGGRVEIQNGARGVGVISGQDLDGLKARVVLVAALATTNDQDAIRSYFERLAGKLD